MGTACRRSLENTNQPTMFDVSNVEVSLPLAKSKKGVALLLVFSQILSKGSKHERS